MFSRRYGEVNHGLTSSGRARMLDWAMGVSSAPANIWFGLCVEPPGDAVDTDLVREVPVTWTRRTDVLDPTTEETVVTGYSRQKYPFGGAVDVDGASWEKRPDGSLTNTQDIVWPDATGDWPEVRGWFVVTSAVFGGDIIAAGETMFTVLAGDSLVLTAGGVSIVPARLVM